MVKGGKEGWWGVEVETGRVGNGKGGQVVGGWMVGVVVYMSRLGWWRGR